MWNILFSPRTLPDPPSKGERSYNLQQSTKTLYKKDFTSCYRGLLFIVILNVFDKLNAKSLLFC